MKNNIPMVHPSSVSPKLIRQTCTSLRQLFVDCWAYARGSNPVAPRQDWEWEVCERIRKINAVLCEGSISMMEEIMDAEISKKQNSNMLIPFTFEGSSLTAINRDGEAWFIGNEVATALGYARPENAVANHCKAAEFLRLPDLGSLGIVSSNPNGMKLIPERDLYRLVMRSKLPAAEAFEEKVVGEILPAIRKTGSYNAQPAIAAPTNLKEALLLAVEQQEKIEALEERDNALKLIEGDSSSLKVRDVGREIGIGQKRVTEFLLEHKWACRDSKRRLRPAHYGLSMGYVALDTTSFVNPKTQETMLSDDIRITRKGIVRLAEIFSKEVSNG